MSEIGCSQHTYPVSACLLKPTSCTAVLCDLDQHVVCLLAGWLAESGWLAERNSRCAMLTGVQAAWNGDELKIVRHAQRLIALAPHNPASFELLSYVQMKNTETLPDAAK